MKTWCTLCSLLIAIVAGINLAGALRRVPPPARHAATPAGDVVVQQERRLAGVRDALRDHGARGLIGYVVDLSPAQLPADPTAMQEYFLSQFVLAPWVLEPKVDDCAWAVANFHESAPAERIPAGFRIVQDFGRGVMLLRKDPP
jgi:hypothetical protein